MRVAWALVMLAGAACGQDAVPTLKISTRVVAVSAVVLDGQGLPVRDLTKDQFVLKQDGRVQEIRYFSEDSDLPLTLALMVDTSGSEKAYLEDEILASEKFFKSVMRRPTDRAALYQFDAGVNEVAPMTAAVPTLVRSLNMLTYPRGMSMDAMRGGTRLYEAIDLASRAELGKERGRKAMVILTDGEDVGSRVTLEQAVKSAQKADVVVYAVMMGEAEQGPRRVVPGAPRGIDVMKDISSATGGRVFTLSTGMRLADAYELIEEDLRLQYQIGYTPPSDEKAGSYHKIDLKVEAGKKMTVQARKGYYAPE